MTKLHKILICTPVLGWWWTDVFMHEEKLVAGSYTTGYSYAGPVFWALVVTCVAIYWITRQP